jgi:hypothetical protein
MVTFIMELFVNDLHEPACLRRPALACLISLSLLLIIQCVATLQMYFGQGLQGFKKMYLGGTDFQYGFHIFWQFCVY